MSLKNEITHDSKAEAWSALGAFRATFPAPTAENRAIEARLEADLAALREADGSLFDDRADELIRWADKNEALAEEYPSAAKDYRHTASLFRAEAAELRRKAIVVRAATFGMAA